MVAVWKQYEALYNHLAEAASDTSRTQRERAQYAGLKTKISTNEFVLNLGVLRDAGARISKSPSARILVDG